MNIDKNSDSIKIFNKEDKSMKINLDILSTPKPLNKQFV